MRVCVILGNKLENDSHMSQDLINRLGYFLSINKVYHIDYVIVTGGKRNKRAKCSESLKMKEYLINHGIDESIIIEENQALTTIGNAYYSTKIIKELQADEVIITTSYNHFGRMLFNPMLLFYKQLSRLKVKVITYTKNE